MGSVTSPMVRVTRGGVAGRYSELLTCSSLAAVERKQYQQPCYPEQQDELRLVLLFRPRDHVGIETRQTVVRRSGIDFDVLASLQHSEAAPVDAPLHHWNDDFPVQRESHLLVDVGGLERMAREQDDRGVAPTDLCLHLRSQIRAGLDIKLRQVDLSTARFFDVGLDPQGQRRVSRTVAQEQMEHLYAPYAFSTSSP